MPIFHISMNHLFKYYYQTIILNINPLKKFFNLHFSVNTSLVRMVSYLTFLSLESVFISLYNDVPFVMIM